MGDRAVDERFRLVTDPRTDEAGAVRPDNRDENIVFPSVKHEREIGLPEVKFQLEGEQSTSRLTIVIKQADRDLLIFIVEIIKINICFNENTMVSSLRSHIGMRSEKLIVNCRIRMHQVAQNLSFNFRLAQRLNLET